MLASLRPVVYDPWSSARRKQQQHWYQIIPLGMTEAHLYEQLAQGRYLTVPRLGVDPGTFRSPVRFVVITPPSLLRRKWLLLIKCLSFFLLYKYCVYLVWMIDCVINLVVSLTHFASVPCISSCRLTNMFTFSRERDCAFWNVSCLLVLYITDSEECDFIEKFNI